MICPHLRARASELLSTDIFYTYVLVLKPDT